MNKLFSKNNKFYLSLIMLMLALVFCISGTGLNLIGVEAATTLSSASLSYTAKSRKDETLSASSNGLYLGESYNQFSYGDINKVILSFNNNNEVEAADSYGYRIDVDFAQKYINDETFNAPDGHYHIEGVASGTVTELNQISKAFYFDVHEDDKAVANPTLKSHKDYGIGWGIYKFTINIGRNVGSQTGELYYNVSTTYIYVAPTTPNAAAQNDPKIISSQSGLQNAYEFSLSDPNFKYADQSLIVWYVKGESIDGKKYVLTNSDKGATNDNELLNFRDYDNALFDSINRTGYTFTFDPNVGGNWEVYCVVYQVDHTTTRLISNVTTVTTGVKIEASILIWILIAVGVVLLALIIFIIIRTKKKEKVW